MDLSERLQLINMVDVDYAAGRRMGHVSYEQTENVALRALDEAINVLDNYPYIFELQLKLMEYNISHKLHNRQIVEINNVQGNILDVITEVYDDYCSHSNICDEGQISQMFVVDEGGGACVIIVPKK